MKVIFDFDDTIFDTKKFKEEVIFNALESFKVGISASTVSREYEIYSEVNPVFSFADFFQSILGKYSLTKDIDLDRIYEGLGTDMSKYLIPGYEKIIRSLGKENVIILTQGEEDFQRFKVASSGISKIVMKVVVVSAEKQKPILEFCNKYKDEKVFFIDNNFSNFVLENIPENLEQVLISKTKVTNKNLGGDKIKVIKNPRGLEVLLGVV